MSQQPHDLQQERELLEHFRQHSQGEPSAAVDTLIPVSYTHLTLPTSVLV
mgnify:CR=1 FL=1